MRQHRDTAEAKPGCGMRRTLGVEVKLLLLSGRMGAPAGHSLLFAVSAGPPHDGVRKARRLNLSHDLAGVPPAGSGLSTRSRKPTCRGYMRVASAAASAVFSISSPTSSTEAPAS